MDARTTPRRAVIAGVDALPEAQHVLSWAAAEAELRHWPLRIVNVVDHPSAQVALPIGSELVLAKDHQEAQRIVDTAVAEVRRTRPSVDVSGEWVSGAPATVLARLGGEQNVLVVGSRGHGPVVSALLGSISSDVSRRASCPVVVVREAAPPPSPTVRGTVILGVDGSAASVNATAFAFEEASLREVPLTVVHAVWNPYTASQAVVAVAADPRRVVVDESELLDVAETIAGWREQYPDVGVVTRYENGRPDRVLANLSRAADLLVVGARGRSNATAALLGSVSREVVRSAQCPVAVVRGSSRDLAAAS